MNTLTLLKDYIFPKFLFLSNKIAKPKETCFSGLLAFSPNMKPIAKIPSKYHRQKLRLVALNYGKLCLV